MASASQLLFGRHQGNLKVFPEISTFVEITLFSSVDYEGTDAAADPPSGYGPIYIDGLSTEHLINVREPNGSPTYKAWSRYATDVEGGGLAWFTDYAVKPTGGPAVAYGAGGYATEAEAESNFTPSTTSGNTSYSVYLPDDAPSDNRDGLSLDISLSVPQDPEFTPADIFAGGANGVWWDFNDVSTLFQDSAGTTPVTSDGDPIGLVLDKSGNGIDGIQTDSASRPIYRNNGAYGWVESTGGTQHLIATIPSTDAVPLTIFTSVDTTKAAGDTTVSNSVFVIADSVAARNALVNLAGYALNPNQGPTLARYDNTDGFTATALDRTSFTKHSLYGKYVTDNKRVNDIVGRSEHLIENDPTDMNRISLFAYIRAGGDIFYKGEVQNAIMVFDDVDTLTCIKTRDYLAASFGV